MGLSRVTYGISLVGWYRLYEFIGAHFALPEERYYVQVKRGGENTLLDYFWLELVNGNEIPIRLVPEVSGTLEENNREIGRAHV